MIVESYVILTELNITDFRCLKKIKHVIMISIILKKVKLSSTGYFLIHYFSEIYEFLWLVLHSLEDLPSKFAVPSSFMHIGQQATKFLSWSSSWTLKMKHICYFLMDSNSWFNYEKVRNIFLSDHKWQSINFMFFVDPLMLLTLMLWILFIF